MLQVPRSDPAAKTGTTVPSNSGQVVEPVTAADEELDMPVKTSLLAATAQARKGAPKETEDQKRLKEEQEMLHNITNRTALKTFAELAAVGALQQQASMECMPVDVRSLISTGRECYFTGI